MSRLEKLHVLMILLLLCACASQRYRYVPASVVDNHIERPQKGKAYYKIPSDSPTGSVRMVSGGIVKLRSLESGTTFPVLHLRMLLSNESSRAPWTVDAQAQTVVFPNSSSQSPLFAQSESTTSSTLTVNLNEMKVLDLYFSLPDSRKSAKEIPEFDFHWQVQAGSQLVKETTAFERVGVSSYSYSDRAFYYSPYDSPYNPYYSYSPYDYPPYSGFWPYSYGPDGGFGWSPPLVVVPPLSAVPRPSVPVIVGH